MTAAAAMPVLVSQAIGNPMAGALVSLGALLVSIADQGGPFHYKAAAMVAATGLVVLTGAVATVAGNYTALAILLMFLIATLAGMAAIYGNQTSTVGFVVLLAFLLLLPLPGTPGEALERAGLLFAGGAWGLALSLWLWPIRPFFPVLRLVAAAYRAIAVFVSKSAQGTDGSWKTALTPERTAVIDALNKAREALIGLRSSRQGSSPTGQRLLVLIRTADRLYSAAVVFAEIAEQIRRVPEFAEVEPKLALLREELSRVLVRIAAGVERGGGSVELAGLEELISPLDLDLSGVAGAGGAETNGSSAAAVSRNLIRAIETLERHLDTAAERTRRLGYVKAEETAETFDQDTPHTWRSRLQELRDNLTPSSLTLRHSLRLGVATAATVAIYHVWEIPRGAWMTLTVAVILKPDFSGTRQRAWERVGGTVAGAFAAALLMASHPGPLVQSILLVVTGIATFAQINQSYRRFVAFLTVFVIVLVESVHPGEAGIVWLRVFNTVIGGALAVVAGYALWPKWAKEDFLDQIAKTFQANRLYLEQVLNAYERGAGPPGFLRSHREKAQLENSNASASFQRVLGESWGKNRLLEPYYSLVNSNQRIFDTAVALSTHLPHVRLPEIGPLKDKLLRAMDELEQAAAEKRLARVAGMEDEFGALEAIHRRELLGIGMLIGRVTDEVQGAARALGRIPRQVVPEAREGVPTEAEQVTR